MSEVQENTTPQPEGINAVDPKFAQVYEQKAMELQEIVAQQVMAADKSKPTTMTEMLADEQGAFAAKAQELGLTQEWAQFKEAQPAISKMREEFLEIEEKRSATANAVADITPQLNEQAAGLRKTGGIAAAAGAIASGAAAGFAAGKLTQNRALRAGAAVVGALVGGATAAMAAIRKSAKTRMEKIGEQVGGLDNLQPDPKLEERAAELHQQLGEAQQQSMETMVDSMVTRMAENEIAAQHAAEQAAAVAAAPAPEAKPEQQAAPEAAAPAAPEQPFGPQPEPAQASAVTEDPKLDALLAELQQASQQTQQAGAALAETPSAPSAAQSPAELQPSSHVEALNARRAEPSSPNVGRS